MHLDSKILLNCPPGEAISILSPLFFIAERVAIRKGDYSNPVILSAKKYEKLFVCVHIGVYMVKEEMEK